MIQKGTKKLNNVLKFSGCLTEHDIAYPGNDLNKGGENIQPDFESCRVSCRSIMGALYFTYTKDSKCWCKSSNAGRTEKAGKVSGETCSGEKIFPNCFCMTFCSMMHTLIQ